ncbi:hypothetical protein [Demequina lutea]|uniref:Uncharacterized protein n=1 Tax=Demequina lutea TaxID=431489 RepID=A0A7Y9ZGE8_9MICO|nr:hypothetical protein [Demequina lutea]NYI42896.1 hypothetical protein [Demequina lutea]
MTGWPLVQAISLRAHVRLAHTLSDGSVSADNKYPERANIAGPDPGVPWVVHLADESGLYRLLAFDFDAHHDTSEAARHDAYALVALLERLGDLPYVVCESGPSGGLHVWLAPRHGLPAATVATLARIASRLYPTLDIAPLTNPTTGGVRPPGSPHRHGGRSTVLFGDLTALTQPTATAGAIERLMAELDAIAPTPAPAETREGLALVDRTGRLYLPGPRTVLGTAATAALRNPVRPDQDASAVLFSCLLGAARARWRYNDLHELLDTAPGLEYARTERHSHHRVPRSPAQQHRLLARHWDRAVRHAAATRLTAPRSGHTDLAPKAALVNAVVAAALSSMAACPGRWTHADAVPKGVGNQRAIDRLVLIELYQRAIDGITTTVRASVRTLAMSLPVGRESVRESLMRLATDGWIGLSEATDGPAAATWSIDPRGVFHREAGSSRSALGLVPNASPLLEVWRQRSELSSTLNLITDLASHDVFTPRALGLQAGYLYAQLHQAGRTTLASLCQVCGLTPAAAQTTLQVLHGAGLALRSGLQWAAAPPEARDRAAQLHGTTGTLAARRRAYQLEQATWAYWLEELALTSKAAPLAVQRQRVVRLANGNTVGLAPYPRRPNRQGDWRKASERIAMLIADDTVAA